jgi:hypothetical protein
LGLYRWIAWQDLPGVPDKPTSANKGAKA